jgi:N6-L-threonylcarbamoyladenine synthase
LILQALFVIIYGMLILGIETSCDDTGLALYDSARGLLAHKIFSQQIHQQYGGVVPELASRNHLCWLTPLLTEILTLSNTTVNQLDGIAYTKGPGLIGALLTGASFAKALAYTLQIPTIGVHHLEGHILAPFLSQDCTYPFIALLISGGHTMIIQVNEFNKYIILGETLDDALGEAFDKTAKLMGLPYPGGPLLAKLAATTTSSNIKLPRPLLGPDSLDFSFSGLKTNVMRVIQNTDPTNYAQIAFAFEQTVAEVLLTKIKRAIELTQINTVILAGGVSANLTIRSKFKQLEQQGITIRYPKLEFCTDNGAMIAYAGYQRLVHGFTDLNYEIDCRARWDLANC